MVIQSPSLCSSNPNGPTLTKLSPTMLPQGGFFGKSRHAPVSSVDLKRNNGGGMPPPNYKAPGVGPQAATGGNMTPLGTPNHVQRNPSNSNGTQPSMTSAQISEESTQSQTALKSAAITQSTVDSNRSGSFEAPDKESRDGTRPRKSVMRKTVDHNSSFLSMLERRVWQRDFRDKHALQPDVLSYPEMVPPIASRDNTSNAVTTRFVKTATNKMRCPIFTLAWTPEGRRLITGASSGEFTLWNGLTFNFETILQAHDSAVRAMKWSHNDTWMVTGDHGGYIKYWQSNMNNVKMFQAHKEPIRDVSFSPTDTKFASCSDDGTVRVWDFFTCREERVLRGHGADVKCVDWHPTQGLLASGSKDNQQPIKIWEPKSGAVLTTIHAHKSTVMDVRWNPINGNWLLTASRDHLIKLFDIRNTKEEVQTFRGHKREASAIAWHPIHEGVFSSGGSDGAIMFWSVGSDKETGAIETAHENIVWALAWHPIGHILCSGSNDHTCKYWTRNRPGDTMRDKYNLNTLPFAQEHDDIATSGGEIPPGAYVGGNQINRTTVIPGMAPEDRVPGADDHQKLPPHLQGFNFGANIPGLDRVQMDDSSKKVPYAKPIPKNFQNSWNHDIGPPSQQPNPMNNMHGPPGPYPGGGPPMGPPGHMTGPPGIGGLRPNNSGNVGSEGDNSDFMSLQELQRQATAVVAFGNVYPMLPGSNLYMSVLSGEMSVKDILRSEFLS